MFETKRSVFSEPLIQPLLLMKIERPANLTFDKMKYEIAKPVLPPSKTNFNSKKEWATESSPEFVTIQLTNETECYKYKCVLKVSLKYFDYINLFLINF